MSVSCRATTRNVSTSVVNRATETSGSSLEINNARVAAALDDAGFAVATARDDVAAALDDARFRVAARDNARFAARDDAGCGFRDDTGCANSLLESVVRNNAPLSNSDGTVFFHDTNGTGVRNGLFNYAPLHVSYRLFDNSGLGETLRRALNFLS